MMDQLNEDFLHFVWQYQLFDHSNLQTTYHQPIEIISKGNYNHNQGADFLNAKVKIGHEIMVGHVEIHKRNEEWYQHQHQLDSRYDNTILHVVYRHTDEIYTLTHSQNQIPILCLEPYLSKTLLHQAMTLIKSQKDIACTAMYQKPEPIQLESFKNKLILERLYHKATWIRELIEKNNHDIETSFYQVMLYGFGLKVNAPYFLEIAQKTPIKVLARYKYNIETLEALLMGQANLLSEPTDPYGQQLETEYVYLKQLHQLQHINSPPLRSRMMPASFPTIRLAQFAAFICNQHGLYSKMIHAQSLDEIKNYFQINASSYWETHYQFGKISEPHATSISRTFFHKIVINVLLPFYLIYDESLEVPSDRVLKILEEMPSEINKITKKMNVELGLEHRTALDSQALIQWYNEYCQKKRCLACPVGFKLFSKSP